MKNTTIGMIGFGRIGKLLTRYFAKDFRLYVHDAKPQPREIKRLGAIPSSLRQACAQDAVILCVPISDFKKAVSNIKNLVKPGALVVDVCSVKEYPVKIMKEALPKSVEILATHPNFGPDSAAQSLKGQKMVLHKVRVAAKRYKKIKNYLKALGLDVVELSPREHDRQMAHSLLLTHFVGRSLIDFGAKNTQIDTEGYKRLMHILQTVQNDSWQLFQDMNRYNAFAKPMRQKFLASMRAIDARA